MSKFTTVYTWNGALSYASPDPSGETSGRLSLFFKGARGLEVSRLYEYLRDSANESLLDTFLLAFHLRDCRGGKGERELGRRAFIWLFINYPVQFRNVLPLIAEYGRWDDLIELFPGMLKLEYTTPESEYLQFLQNEVVQLVATQLRTDRAAMLIGKPCSLCAKWTPTEGDRHDRKTGVFRTLAAAVGVSARSLRKNYNTPLRTYIKIVERYMCSGQWEEIDFNKVPSQAMKRLKKAFEKHQPEKYAVWRNALKLGYTKVNAKQLHPHELVREMRSKNISDPVTEAQWKILAEEVHKLGSLKDAVVVVDTSLSMCSPNYIPLDVAIAMGMLISDMVQGPFHGHVITFNQEPIFQVVPDGSAYNRFFAIRNMSWGGTTNLEGTFKLILDRATGCKLSQEDMPKRLFIISDMQFNKIDNDNCTTNWERINEMYITAGYNRPQLIFWNVNGASTDFPVTSGEQGTALISGFSPAILNTILNGDELTPVGIMRIALDDTRYDAVRTALGIVSEKKIST